MYDIDYKNNCFEFPELSRIQVEPTTSALLILCNRVQSNAQFIDSTLGGGANGHLGLVCDTSTYSSIPEVNNVERTLIQQLIKAVDAKYLTAICNPATQKITCTIQQIFDYLFDAYGDVSPSQLQELCNSIENISFDPYKPVNTLYTEINSFANLAKIGHSPITDRQNRLCLSGTAKN
eukprot:4120126-Ditylum_brightwellii.AAC.1